MDEASRNAVISLLEKVFTRALGLVSAVDAPGMRAFDRAQQVTVAYRMLVRYQLVRRRLQSWRAGYDG